MAKLKLKRYLQDPSYCAVASSASIVNYYNSKLNYENTKTIAEDFVGGEEVMSEGMYTGEIAQLFNLLGFKDVTVVSSCIDYLDFSWAKLSKSALIKNLKKMSRIRKDMKENAKSMVRFLEESGYNNQLIIDYKFGDYIRKSIDKGIPVSISFKWTVFLRFEKYNDKGKPDAFKGDDEEHAVVIVGYDDKGVHVVDSHNKFYKYRLKKYRKGRYHILWEDLMYVISDVVIPSNYQEDLLKYEF